MDRWVLASCQSLIQFVREEMNAYRLYTVVPRLLTLIDTLTNWYVRFNRKRLKVRFLSVAGQCEIWQTNINICVFRRARKVLKRPKRL
jgi:isoleucyl-tRNA synthetase